MIPASGSHCVARSRPVPLRISRQQKIRISGSGTCFGESSKLRKPRNRWPSSVHPSKGIGDGVVPEYKPAAHVPSITPAVPCPINVSPPRKRHAQFLDVAPIFVANNPPTRLDHDSRNYDLQRRPGAARRSNRKCNGQRHPICLRKILPDACGMQPSNMIDANRVRCSVDLDNAFIALNRIARNALNREPCQPEIAGD